jgi:hypothetical protein
MIAVECNTLPPVSTHCCVCSVYRLKHAVDLASFDVDVDVEVSRCGG